MKSGDLSRQEQHRRRSYVAPGFARVSPQEAKELLLRDGGTSDPAVREMLDRIEKILGREAPAVRP
jgi:hypothetical protein